MPISPSARLAQLPPYLFVAIRRKIREAQQRGIDVISLGAGDPDGATAPHVVEALKRAADDPVNHHYPTGEHSGMPAFREAIAAWYGRRFGVNLDPGREVLGLIGSKEGNHHFAIAMLDPGDVAIVPDPAYPAYVSSIVLAGASVARVPLHASNGFLLDFDDVPAELAKKAKAIWLSYPNNPTAAVAPLAFWERAVAWAKQNDVVIVSDNPYSEIAFDGLRVPSALEPEGARDVVVEFGSLSKPYNMTGWRVGMAVGNAEVLAAISQVKENTDSGVFNAVQYAAIAALTGPQDLIARNVALYQRRRDVLVAALRALGLDAASSQATFYVWTPVPAGQTSMTFAERLLEHAGVVVIPGSGYGAYGEGFVRLSLSVPDARLDEAIRRIQNAWGRIASSEPAAAATT